MSSRKYTSLPFSEKPVATGNFGTTGRLPIDTIVWHTAQGTLAGTLSWFNNKASGVSSNYLMDKNGQLYAMLEEYYVPYTNGIYNSNQRSITIEVVDDGNPQAPRSDALYQATAALTRELCTFYGLPIDRAHVKGHREVSNTHPQCPGNLDLDRIVREAQPQSDTIPVDKKTFERLVTKATKYDDLTKTLKDLTARFS
jgi:N-acetyl-anhydromuramyl-L-alanine amidase AmpD